MHNLPSPQGRSKPYHNLLSLVNVMAIINDFGERVDNLLAPQERRDITKTKDRDLKKIIRFKVLIKILVGVVHLILVVPKVVIE